MTQKFEDFRKELVALCVKYEVYISSTGYEHMDVWDSDERFKPEDIWIEDQTKGQP